MKHVRRAAPDLRWLGTLAIMAAELAQEGRSLEDIVFHLRNTSRTVRAGFSETELWHLAESTGACPEDDGLDEDVDRILSEILTLAPAA